MCPHNTSGPNETKEGEVHGAEPSAKRIKLDDDVSINSIQSQDRAER